MKGRLLLSVVVTVAAWAGPHFGYQLGNAITWCWAAYALMACSGHFLDRDEMKKVVNKLNERGADGLPPAWVSHAFDLAILLPLILNGWYVCAVIQTCQWLLCFRVYEVRHQLEMAD